MGTKLLWLGLALMLAVPKVVPSLRVAELVGALLMIIGIVLLFLDK
jgi:hypothetical protein